MSRNPYHQSSKHPSFPQKKIHPYSQNIHALDKNYYIIYNFASIRTSRKRIRHKKVLSYKTEPNLLGQEQHWIKINRLIHSSYD